MKKTIIGIILLVAVTYSFCQQTKPLDSLTREVYLLRSKNEKTAARVLLIGGGVLAATCIIIAAPGTTSFDNLGSLIVGGAIGAVAALGSIPLFIASRNSKRRAFSATTYIKVEKGSFARYQSIRSGSYPALSLRINL